MMRRCEAVSQMLLVSIEPKRIYGIADFDVLQRSYSVQMKAFLTETSQSFTESMKKIYSIFESDSDEVQREWVRFANRVDSKLETALKKCVRRSLQLISKCLNGEKRKEVFFAFQILFCESSADSACFFGDHGIGEE